MLYIVVAVEGTDLKITEYNNCKNRSGGRFVNKSGRVIEYMKCNKDKKSCRLTDMFGMSCYEPEGRKTYES